MITKQTLDQLEAYAAAIVADYYRTFPKKSDTTYAKYSIHFEQGKKYIRVVKTTGGQRSVHSFVEIENGDVWKAASWKTPAKNTPRGNIATLTPRITCWTSAT